MRDSLTTTFRALSNWMDSCVDCGMSLKEFHRRFKKFIKEREEGLKREERDGT